MHPAAKAMHLGDAAARRHYGPRGCGSPRPGHVQISAKAQVGRRAPLAGWAVLNKGAVDLVCNRWPLDACALAPSGQSSRTKSRARNLPSPSAGIAPGARLRCRGMGHWGLSPMTHCRAGPVRGTFLPGAAGPAAPDVPAVQRSPDAPLDRAPVTRRKVPAGRPPLPRRHSAARLGVLRPLREAAHAPAATHPEFRGRFWRARHVASQLRFTYVLVEGPRPRTRPLGYLASRQKTTPNFWEVP